MLPAPLWLALVRAMLVVDDGTRITPLSLHGEGKEEGASPQKRKPTPPRRARQPLPKEGARVVIPSFQRKGGGRMPPHRLPTKKAYDTRMPFSPYCHFERKREIFFVRGQAKDVRIAASWKHRASSESEGRCFMQTALRKKTETGNEKDPSAALGMTKRGNASFHSFSTCCGSQPRLAALGSPFQRKGLAWTLPPSYGRRCPEGAEVGWGSGISVSNPSPWETGRGIHFSFTNFHLSMI